jgi:hypothetical protein
MPVKARDGIVEYTIVAGDSIFGIAQKFDLKPDTILWANYDILNDDPHMISIGLTLKFHPLTVFYTLGKMAIPSRISPTSIKPAQ